MASDSDGKGEKEWEESKGFCTVLMKSAIRALVRQCSEADWSEERAEVLEGDLT